MNSFKEMGLDPLLEKSLETLQFTVPTPIQAQTIPLGLEGKDILGSAQTGTGKTLAFVIPMISKLLKNPADSAMVLVPTRELAQQVAQTVRQILGPKPALKTALLIGGESPFKQLQQIRANARILVGTPGRIIDHLKRESIKPDGIHFLVLDETDRMFDMGFESQIESIIKQLPEERQTVMFSATLPASIIKTASRYLKSPERVAIGTESTPISKIKQEVIFVDEFEKEAKLIEQLAHREESIVIFVKTKWGAERLAEKLANDFEYKAIALHGDLRQNKRERVIASFRRGTHNILVATDIAARGLDIPQIRHIINYDLPQCPEDYIHRIGRTARAGAEGFSLCLVTPKESRNWKIIDRFANSAGGITDADRASLSHKPRRSGGGSSFGQRRSGGGSSSFGGNRRSFDGGERRPSFGSDRPRFERSSSSGYSRNSEGGDRPAYRPRFERSNDGAAEGSTSFTPRPRPASSESSEGGYRDRKPSSFGPRKPFDRDSRGGDRPFRPRNNDGDSFSTSRYSDKTSSDDRPARRPYSSSSTGGDRPFRPARPEGSSFRPSGDRFSDRKPRSEGGSFDRGSRAPFKRRSSSEGFASAYKPDAE